MQESSGILSITIWELVLRELGKEHADILAAAVAVSFNNVLTQEFLVSFRDPWSQADMLAFK